MRNILATWTGKLIRLGLRFRHNGGHALPGLVIEKLFPGYVAAMLGKLPGGVVIITGTNGKTTTTKIVVHLLKSSGIKVLTNSTGSNLIRGIASSLARHATILGGLPYDVAILEIDEASARRLVTHVKPRWVVGLNVSRDQLDRYGEVDTVASYVSAVMQAATVGIVTNADDPNLVIHAEKIGQQKGTAVLYFAADKKLAKFFPTDYELAAVSRNGTKHPRPHKQPEVVLRDFNDQTVTYRIGQKQFSARLKLTGQHNFLNGAAALALCRHLIKDIGDEDLISRLAEVELAFGRGEKYRLKNGAEVELVLVKNPASFTQALSSYAPGSTLMVAINDNIADGRDVSWLWDVSFAPIKDQQVAITSGTRAADMALRLKYDDIKTGSVQNDLGKALKELSELKGDKVILSTYTAMLELYRLLAKKAVKI